MPGKRDLSPSFDRLRDGGRSLWRGGAMRETLAGVPDGLAPLVLARLAEAEGAGSPPLLLHVARDDRRLEALAEASRSSPPRCASSSSRPGTRCPTTASAPNAEIVATRVASHGPAGGGRAQGADRRPHHRQRHPAAPAAARVHPPLAQDDRARPAHRHEPAGPAPRTWPASSAPAPSWRPANTPCAAASSTCSRRGGWPPCASISSATRWSTSRPSIPRRSAPARSCRSSTLMPISEVAFGEEAEKRFRARLCGDVRPRDVRGPALRGRQRRPALSRHGALAAAVPRAAGDAVRLRAGCAASASTTWPSRRSSERLGADRRPLRCARARGWRRSAFGAPPYKPRAGGQPCS